MSLEALLSQYGLAAVFAGAGIEGETAVVVGGLLSHQGYWPVWGSAIAAALGSFTADTSCFLAGRHFQHQRWIVNIRQRPAFRRAIAAFEARPIGFIFLFRFLYGLRTASPIAIGTTQVPTRTFVAANLAAASLWAVLFTTIGYLFGQAFQRMAGSIKAHLWPILIVAAALVAIGLMVRWWRWRRETRA